MARLRICDGCTRHVFVTATHCPFCGATLEAAQLAPIMSMKAGLSRAQRFAIAAAMVGQVACSDNELGGNGGAAGAAGAAGATGGAGGMTSGGAGGASGGGAGGASGAAGGMSAGAGGASGASGASGGAGGMSAGMNGAAGMTGGVGGASGGEGGAAGDFVQPVYGAPIDPPDAGVDSGMEEESGGQMAVPLYGGSFPVYGAPFPDE